MQNEMVLRVKTRWLLMVLCLGAIIGFSWYFQGIFLYLIIAVIMTYLLTPLVDLLSRRIHLRGKSIPRGAATIFSLMLVLGLVVLFFSLFVPVLLYQIESIQKIDTTKLEATYKAPLDNMESWLIRNNYVKGRKGFVLDELKRSITHFLSFDNVSGVLTYVTSAAGELVIGMFAVLFMTFFLVKDNLLFRGEAITLLPMHYQEAVNAAMLRTRGLLSRYFLGIILESSSIIVLEFIGLKIIGFENALVVAVFAGLINPIPYLGPVIAFSFALFVGLTTDMDVVLAGNLTGFILKIMAVFGAVHLVDVLVFQPLITAKSVFAHPLLVFVVIFMGARIAGPFGMFVAIPLFTILRVLFLEMREVYRTSREEKKRLATVPPAFE